MKKEGPQQVQTPVSQLQNTSDDRDSDQRQPSRATEEACTHPILIYYLELTCHVESQNHQPPLPLNGRKRAGEPELPANHILTEHPPKRLRPLPAGPSLGQTFDQDAASGLSASQRSHITHWAAQKAWPKEYFKMSELHRLVAHKRSTPSLQRKRSEYSLVTSATASDQRPREEKSAPYRSPLYRTVLQEAGGSYMCEHELGITDASESLCQTLLQKGPITPEGTLFRDDIFNKACRNLDGKNEARIIKDISQLLIPSAETLATLGATHLNIMVESVNEGWNNSLPVTRPRPQPDYAVGFRQSAFSVDQLSKLRPILGSPSCLSYLKATYYMLFSFFTCEVKCGSIGLDIADRQNAHSMTLAVRAVVELLKIVKREKELHREILAFSVSHDHETVRIYGYYPVFDNTETTIWRHPIRKFDFTELNGKEKWTAYTFTRNVYDIWMPKHFKRICSAIDEFPPDLDFELSQASAPQVSEPSGLSQVDNQTLAEAPDSQSSHIGSQQITPDTSTQPEQSASKKQKK